MDNFEEYLRQGEPNKAEKAKVWKTAIGLQQIDGLKPSDYLIATAKQNIEGDITIDEVKQRIDTYYIEHPTQTNEDRTEEADKVSARIAEHSWYFRNALVRANYKNHVKNIHSTNEFLLRFFENLLLDENHILKNREMHVKFAEPVNDPVKAKNDPVNDPLNDSVQSKILQHLKQNPKANYRELAYKTGYSTATIKRHIQELKKMGIIERIGSDKTGYWKIVKQ